MSSKMTWILKKDWTPEVFALREAECRKCLCGIASRALLAAPHRWSPISARFMQRGSNQEPLSCACVKYAGMIMQEVVH